jgi:hypothetical protein
MRMRNFAALFMSMLVLVMVGCGGGGGSGGTTVPQSGAALSGVASKGPIRNGHIQIFEIVSTSRRLSSTPFFTGTTGADGSFSTNLPASLTKGGVMIQILDGDYTDEATGVVKNIQTEYGATGMRSVFGNISSAVKQGSMNVNVTPYTEMVVLDMNDVYDDSTTKHSQDKIQHAFGFDAKGIDIVRTKPLDTSKAFPAGSTVAEQSYSLAMAGISQYQKDFGAGKNLSGVCHDLLDNHMSRDGVLDRSISDEIATATQTFVDDQGGKTNPVLTDPKVNTDAPAAVHATPSSPVSFTVGSAATISAAVVKADGSPVADGTKVDFTTDFGTLSATRVSTASGLAQVTLTSAAAGSARVTARSGSASGAAATITFVSSGTPPVQPTQAIVKIGTTGVLPAGTLIGGVAATVVYANGHGLSITPASVAMSGGGTGSSLAANTNTAGTVALGLINAQGIASGEYATLTFAIAAGSTPTAADFSIAPGSNVLNIGTVKIPGAGASILSVTIQ